MSIPFGEGVPTESELRVAQAQLVGWLEGLFHASKRRSWPSRWPRAHSSKSCDNRQLPGPMASRPLAPAPTVIVAPGRAVASRGRHLERQIVRPPDAVAPRH